MKIIGSIGIAASALIAVAGLADSARAETVCGYSNPSWNVPAGALVLSQSNGTIKYIMDSIGEKWTHSELSDGASYAYHATRTEPMINSGNSLDPVDLAFGPPGPSKMNIGAQRMFWGTPIDTGWIAGGTAGTNARNYVANLPTCSDSQLIWNRPPTSAGAACGSNYSYSYPFQPTCQTYCKKDFGSGFSAYRVWTNYPYAGNVNGNWAYGFDTWYEFEQYKRAGNLEVGQFYSNDSYAEGAVCSTFIAHLLKKSPSNITISEHHYPNSVINPTVSALRNAVYNQCYNASGGLIGCGSVANQVANCFCSLDECDNNSTWWQGASCQGSTASSISPDRLAGRAIHAGEATNSPYHGGAVQSVTFNSGSVYGCWSKAGG